MTGPLDELRRLDRERTPGEWKVDPADPLCLVTDGGSLIAAISEWNPEVEAADAAFVAACSRLVPVLLDRLDQLEAVAAAARQYLDTGRGDLDGALAALPSPAEETPTDG